MQPIRKQIWLVVLLLTAAMAVSTVIWRRGGFQLGIKPGTPQVIIDPVAVPPLSTSNGQAIFTNYCVFCHSIVKDGTGPALEGCSRREPKGFAFSLLTNPEKTLNSSEYGQALFKAYHKMHHPSFADLPKQDLQDVVFFVNNFGVDRKF